MPKISIINKANVWRKLKRHLRLGLGAAMVYGAIWVTPRVINQYNLSSNRANIFQLVNEEKYREALDEFEELADKKLITRKPLQEQRESLIREIRLSESDRLNKLLSGKDYTGASELFSSFTNEGFFSEGTLLTLEARVQRIHPDKLIEEATTEEDSNKQFTLYRAAERELNDMGEKRPELRDKFVEASLRALQQVYEAKDINQVLAKVNSLIEYIGAQSPDLQDAEESAFFESSGRFLHGILSAEIEGELVRVKGYLDRINTLSQSLGIKDREERMKGLAEYVRNYTIDKGGLSLGLLDNTLDIIRNYDPDAQKSIIDIYLNAEEKVKENIVLSRSFLDSAAMNAESLPEESRSSL